MMTRIPGAIRLALVLAVTAAFPAAASARPAALLGIGGSAPSAPAAEAAGGDAGDYYRYVLLTCSGGVCTADVNFNAKKTTTINLVICVVNSSAGQASGVQIVDGSTYLDLFPIASRALSGGNETAVVRSSTNVVKTGGTFTVQAFSGTASGSACILKGKIEKKK